MQHVRTRPQNNLLKGTAYVIPIVRWIYLDETTGYDTKILKIK